MKPSTFLQTTAFALLVLAPRPQEALAGSLSPDKELRDWRGLANGISGPILNDQSLQSVRRFLDSYPNGAHASAARFAMAESAFQQQKYEEARPIYEALSVEKRGPYQSDSLLRLGELYYNNKNFKDAERAWERLESLSSSRSPLLAEAWYGLALCQLHRQDDVSASKTLERLVAKFPAYANLAKSRELLGILRMKEKRFSDSVKLLDGLNTPTASLYKGLSYFYEGRYLEAAGAFDKLQQSASGTYGEVGAYFKAESFRMARNESLASMAYDEMLKQYPRSRLAPYALTQEASFMIKAGKLPQATRILDQLKEQALPTNVQAYALYLRSRIAVASGDSERALRLLDDAQKLASDTHNDLKFRLGLAKAYDLVQLDRWADAAALMSDLTRGPYHPMGALAAIISGQAASRRGDWKAAVTFHQAALLKYPYSPISDVALGLIMANYYSAHQYQDFVTDSNRLMQASVANFASQNFLWRAYSHMLMAEAYYKLGNFPSASSHFEEALQAPALALPARLALAWSLYHEKKYSAAVKTARQVNAMPEAQPDDRASAFFLIAGSYFEQGNYPASLQAFASFRKDFPKDPHVPETWLQEGWARWQMGDSNDALKCWISLSTLFPQDPLAQEAALQVGNFHFQARQYAQAERILADFLKRWPDSRFAVEAQWSLAQAYYNGGDFAKAVKEYQVFIARYGQDPRVADARGQIMLASYREASKAADPVLLARFVSAYPQSAQAPEAQYQLAHLSFDGKRWPEAIRDFHKLLLDYPESSRAPAGLIETAQAEEHLNDLASAQKDYESLLQLFPANPLAVSVAMHLGAVYFNQQKFSDATRTFRFVLNHDASPETKADATYNLAVSMKKDHDDVGALKAWDEFAAAYPQDPRQIDALLEASAIHLAQKNPQRAIELYSQVLADKRTPDEKKEFLNNKIGDVQLEIGDKAKALEAYHQLLTLSPAGSEWRLSGLAQLAALYEEKEDWTNSLMVYRAIVKSGGRRDWVEAAAKREKEIKKYLREVASRGSAAAPAAPPAAAAPAANPAVASTRRTQ